MPEISVVLPVYRTASLIDELVERLSRSLADFDHELVFVDDASPDGAKERLAALADRRPSVRLLALESNVGQQRAIMAGLDAALGDCIVVMDADLQDPPEAVPTLFDRLQRGDVEVVWAVRHNRYQTRVRSFTGRAFKILLRRFVDIPVGAGSFVAMSRRVVRHVRTLPGRPYLVGMLGAVGLPWATVDVPRSRRPDGGSAWTAAMRLRTGLRAVYDGAVTWRRR